MSSDRARRPGSFDPFQDAKGTTSSFGESFSEKTGDILPADLGSPSPRQGSSSNDRKPLRDSSPTRGQKDRSLRNVNDGFDARPTKSKRSGGFLLLSGLGVSRRRAVSNTQGRVAEAEQRRAIARGADVQAQDEHYGLSTTGRNEPQAWSKGRLPEPGTRETPPSTPKSRERDAKSTRLSSSRRSDNSSANAGTFSHYSPPGRHDGHDVSDSLDSQSAAPAAVNPSQLVRLALSLNENRKLQLSPGNLASPAAVQRRIVSAGLPTLRPLDEPVIPKTSRSLQTSHSSQLSSTRDHSESSPLRDSSSPSGMVPFPHQAFPTQQILDFHPSIATLERAEKVMISFEIFHSYLRLLEYLPPLTPQPPRDRRDNAVMGRAYNPLQSIRNRRFLAREMGAMESSARGWRNPVEVQQWVNSVQLQSTRQEFMKGDTVNLPPWSRSVNEVPNTGAALPQKLKAEAAGRNKKPLANWSINREDLLAESYWLEQDGNKGLIEDKDNHKIFPSLDRAPSPARRRSVDTDDRVDGISENDDDNDSSYMHDDHDAYKSFDLPTFQSRFSQDRDEVEQDDYIGQTQARKGTVRRHLRGRPRTHSYSSSNMSASETESVQLARKRRTRNGSSENIGPLERHMNKMMEIEKSKRPDSMSVERVMTRGSEGGRRMGVSGEVQQAAPRPGSLSRMQTFEEVLAQSKDVGIQPLQRPAARSISESDMDLNASDHESSAGLPTSRELSDRRDVAQPRHRLPRLHFRRRKPQEYQVDSLAERRSSTPSSRDQRNSTDRDTHESARSSIDNTSQIKGANGLDRSRTGTEAKGNTQDNTRPDHKRVRERAQNSTARSIFKSSRIADLAKDSTGPNGYLSRLSDSLGGSATSLQVRLDQSEKSDAMSSSTANSYKHRKGQQSLQIPRPLLGGHGRSLSADNLHDSNSSIAHRLQDLPNFVSAQGKDRTGPGGFLKRVDTRLDELRRSRSPVKSPESSRDGSLPRLELPGSDDVSPNNSSINLLKAATRNRKGLSPIRGITEPSDSDSDVRSTSSRLNKALGMAGGFGSRIGKPPTGLANVGLKSRRRSSISPGHRTWSIDPAQVRLSQNTPVVTAQDVAYVRSLLIACGVKASAMLAQADAIRDPPSEFLVRAAEACGRTTKPAPKRHEHVVAARMLSEELERTMQGFEGDTHRFQTTTRRAMLDRLGDARDHAGTRLLGRVRGAAGDAEASVARLTSAHTLAGKQVNDRVDSALRGRRRRLRWLARSGFAALEWAVVALMWCIWGLVLGVRCVRWVVVAALRAARWLLWL